MIARATLLDAAWFTYDTPMFGRRVFPVGKPRPGTGMFFFLKPRAQQLNWGKKMALKKKRLTNGRHCINILIHKHKKKEV